MTVVDVIAKVLWIADPASSYVLMLQQMLDIKCTLAPASGQKNAPDRMVGGRVVCCDSNPS